MLLLEDMPADERVRKGNVIFKTRVARRRRHDRAAGPRRGSGDRGGRDPDRRAARRCGRWPTTSSTRSRTAIRATGSSSKPHRGRWPPGGWRRSGGARCGSSRCQRWSSPIACAACSCSTSRRSTSCSASPASVVRCGTSRSRHLRSRAGGRLAAVPARWPRRGRAQGRADRNRRRRPCSASRRSSKAARRPRPFARSKRRSRSR